MYDYAASRIEAQRTAELNRRLEIRRIALERRAEQATCTTHATAAQRIAAGIRRVLPAARRARTARHA